VQLYATRSGGSWGIGDLADLRSLARWSRGLGAGAMLVNPLGAPNPGLQPEPSPYYPSSRRFRDPLAIAVERVAGYGDLAAELEPHAARARELNAKPSIDRRAVLAAKLAALERVWHATRREDAADHAGHLAGGDEALRQWGVFAALTERHGAGWRQWPAALRDPASAAVRRPGGDIERRAAFHVWLQGILDVQLAEAGSAMPLIVDLPIGFDPGGFDAWSWQPMLADASLGAPPDRFNPAGQGWGLPPFVPARLREAGYRPLIDTIRATLRQGGGVRIDHVLGFFRQWWVPEGSKASDGAYVRQPSEELLAVLAIESQRAGALVIGEDLGTVPRGVRRRLAAANVLSTRLAYFEPRPPARWPRRSVAAVTTHDLPTIAGAWTGVDLDDQAAAGLRPEPTELSRVRRRLAGFPGVTPVTPLEEVVLRVHRVLAAAPSVLVLASLEDATLDPRRPNLPGTTSGQRDNWSHALPRTLERLKRDPLVKRLVRALARS
jgi:4-alpha-glucanotransferase